MNAQLVAHVFTLLVSLPHVFAMMAAVCYMLNRTHFTRAIIRLKRFQAFSVSPYKSDTREPLLHGLETPLFTKH